MNRNNYTYGGIIVNNILGCELLSWCFEILVNVLFLFLNISGEVPNKCSGYIVKNEWRYTCTPPICLHGMDRYNFTSDSVSDRNELFCELLGCVLTS